MKNEEIPFNFFFLKKHEKIHIQLRYKCNIVKTFLNAPDYFQFLPKQINTYIRTFAIVYHECYPKENTIRQYMNDYILFWIPKTHAVTELNCNLPLLQPLLLMVQYTVVEHSIRFAHPPVSSQTYMCKKILISCFSENAWLSRYKH